MELNFVSYIPYYQNVPKIVCSYIIHYITLKVPTFVPKKGLNTNFPELLIC